MCVCGGGSSGKRDGGEAGKVGRDQSTRGLEATPKLCGPSPVPRKAFTKGLKQGRDVAKFMFQKRSLRCPSLEPSVLYLCG